MVVKYKIVLKHLALKGDLCGIKKYTSKIYFRCQINNVLQLLFTKTIFQNIELLFFILFPHVEYTLALQVNGKFKCKESIPILVHVLELEKMHGFTESSAPFFFFLFYLIYLISANKR